LVCSKGKLTHKDSLLSCCKFHWRGKIIFITPVVTMPILALGFCNDRAEYKCIYLIVNMAVFWISECIPLYVTSLLPLVFLPLFGILSTERCCSLFFTNTLVMFIAGLFLAVAIEYSNLHKRIALGTILLAGCSPRRLLLGLMVVTVFLSMWISNSATTALMCPIIKAILSEMEAEKLFSVYMTQDEEPVGEGEPPHPSKMSMAFYFGVAYTASIGGISTLIGTGTNLTFKGIYETRFPKSKEKITFPGWMVYAIPIGVIVNLLMLYISLQITHMALFRPNSKIGQEVKTAIANNHLVHGTIKQNFAELGRMTCHEIQIIIIFSIMIVLLFTSHPGFMPGWSDALNLQGVEGSAVMLLFVVILFALPTQYTFFKYCCGSAPFTGRTMDACISWNFIHNNMPWGLCFLIGGGFALAEGSKVSGMAKMLGESLSFVSTIPRDVVIGVTLLISIFCTTFSSNVAVCNILTPVFCEMVISSKNQSQNYYNSQLQALAVKIHPLLLTLPACLVMSFSFFLPVSTPPNAIISGYANIKTKYMAMAGILPTVFGVLLLWINAVTWGILIYPGTKEFPAWAK
ncbi:hypothetical protein KR093_006949, partial [Drosophila rubida]